MTAAATAQPVTHEAERVAAWKRITAAIVAGAPIPESLHVSLSGQHIVLGYHRGDTVGDAAAMVRALGFASQRDDGFSTHSQWEATDRTGWWVVEAFRH